MRVRPRPARVSSCSSDYCPRQLRTALAGSQVYEDETECREEAVMGSFRKCVLSTSGCRVLTRAPRHRQSLGEAPKDTRCEQAPLERTGARGYQGAVLEGAGCLLRYRGRAGGQHQEPSRPLPRHPGIPMAPARVWGQAGLCGRAVTPGAGPCKREGKPLSPWQDARVDL